MTSRRAGTAVAKLFDLLEELSMEIAELNADIEETREQVQQKALFLRAGLERISRMAGLGEATLARHGREHYVRAAHKRWGRLEGTSQST